MRPIVGQQGQSRGRTVTSARRPGTLAAERKRQQRARDNAALLFERDDWLLFIDAATLPQKAGCQPENLRQIVLRELVDNALDAGAQARRQRLDHFRQRTQPQSGGRAAPFRYKPAAPVE